jgi:hypothetical protein
MERFAEILGNVDLNSEVFITRYKGFNIIMYDFQSITLFSDDKYLFIILRDQYVVFGGTYIYVFLLDDLRSKQVAEIMEIMEEHKDQKIMDICPTLIQYLLSNTLLGVGMNSERWERLYKLVSPVKCKSARAFT